MAVILYPSADNWGEQTVIKCLSQPVAVAVETAGRAYQSHLYPKAAVAKVEKNTTKDADLEALRKKCSKSTLKLDDYYKLLGLEKEHVFATEKQIKERWAILKQLCHPDKSAPDERDFAEQRYKAQQKAAAVLSVNSTRRGYDSTLPFDESIPKATQGTGDDFFKVYGPTFERNSKFSETQPVPPLGDANTPYENVDKFYDFWFSFKSWRDFTYLDEHHPDDNCDRFEKREMERKNKKLREGKKKEEVARVRKLAEDGMKKDPRVIAHKAAIENAKEFAKSEKKRLAQEKIDTEAKTKADAEKAAEEAKKIASQDAKYKKEAQNMLKKMRTKLRKVCSSPRAGVQNEDDVEILCAALTTPELGELCKLFGFDADNMDTPLPEDQKAIAVAKFAEKLAEVKGKEEAEKMKAIEIRAAQLELEKEMTASKAWTVEEDEFLEKAVRKFKGKYNAWEQVHELMLTISPDRTLKEVTKRANEPVTSRTYAAPSDSKQVASTYAPPPVQVPNTNHGGPKQGHVQQPRKNNN